MQYKVRDVYIFSTIIIVVLNTLVIGYFWIDSVYDKYDKNFSDIKGEYIEAQKVLLSREVNYLVKYIEKEKNSIGKRVSTIVKNRVDTFYSVYQGIYKSYSHLPRKELQQHIKTILSSVSNQKNSIYINTTDGKSVVLPKNFSDKIKYTVENEIKFLKNHSSGYVITIYKDNNIYKKRISYVKKIDKFDWYIAVAMDYIDMEKIVKKEILEKIKSMKYSRDGYFFVLKSNGVFLFNPSQEHLENKNLIDFSLRDGRKIIREKIDMSTKFISGSYLSYYWYKPSSEEIVQKVSYIKKVEDWDWVIGKGLYADSIDDMITTKESAIDDRIRNDILKIITILIVIALCAAILSSFLSKKLRNSFDTLNNFFTKVTKESIKIDENKISYDEFKSLTKSINYMLEEKLKVEKKLREHSLELENRVEKEIENRREKEILLVEQSKMAAMGEMIGNIAHQWRQPLTELSTIFMNINFKFKRGKLEESYLQKKITQSEHIIEFMSHTIDDFRNFYSQDKSDEVFSIYKSCNNVINILSSVLKYHHISSSLYVDNDLVLRGSRSEFEQVILNIVSNAKDVLIQNRTKKGYIKIYSIVSLDKVSIIIDDNAGGIQVSPIEKVFEPYFSTKHQSKGTGIGLYMSKTIIESKFNAYLKVSNIKNGARFEIVFDVFDKKDSKKTE
jgi:C4-dicarboxylate-specific signal transduction histidine kinase